MADDGGGGILGAALAEDAAAPDDAAAEQARLAAALRNDPELRRSLRSAAVGEARLAQAVRAARMPAAARWSRSRSPSRA